MSDIYFACAILNIKFDEVCVHVKLSHTTDSVNSVSRTSETQNNLGLCHYIAFNIVLGFVAHYGCG